MKMDKCYDIIFEDGVGRVEEGPPVPTGQIVVEVANVEVFQGELLDETIHALNSFYLIKLNYQIRSKHLCLHNKMFYISQLAHMLALKPHNLALSRVKHRLMVSIYGQ